MVQIHFLGNCPVFRQSLSNIKIFCHQHEKVPVPVKNRKRKHAGKFSLIWLKIYCWSDNAVCSSLFLPTLIIFELVGPFQWKLAAMCFKYIIWVFEYRGLCWRKHWEGLSYTRGSQGEKFGAAHAWQGALAGHLFYQNPPQPAGVWVELRDQEKDDTNVAASDEPSVA